MAQSIAANQIPENITLTPGWKLYFPGFLALVGGLAMLGLKLQMGDRFISDTALMMLALACYLLAAIFGLTNLYAKSAMAQKISMVTATAGVFFNFASWLVRWVAAYEHEIAIMRAAGNMETPWMFRYIPFANLYDLSLAFAFGAGIATLFLASREKFRFLSAFTLPLAAMILTLARFIGSEFVELPPVLDSYWRPIHVGVASLSYGMALVCFAIAVIYLLKDKVKVESMAIWASLFSFAVIATVSKFSVFSEFVYRSALFLPNMTGGKPFSTPFRLDMPFVGPLLAVAGILSLATAIAFVFYHYKDNLAAKNIGHWLLKASFLSLLAGVGLLVYGLKTTTDIPSRIVAQMDAAPAQYVAGAKDLAARQREDITGVSVAQLQASGKGFVKDNNSRMFLATNSNPVELMGLITGTVGLFFVLIFGFRTDRLRENLPSLDSLDGLMYKTASLTFAGLAMLLITGAIWANESWGRPWGFDSKETGALVAWLTYAAFLHTRISRGWSGRSSAYFAIIGFFLVIFTYLGVSYLLPGLHSYA
jgi:ABC-type transport system involved in cytochrome c biogenesis permease subunit